MIGRRLQYALLLLGAAAYFLASGQWLSWVLLLAVLGLPWLSLLLSLPAILDIQVTPAGEAVLETGGEADLWLLANCRFPMPGFCGGVRLTELMTGESWRFDSRDTIDTTHCGGLLAETERVRVYDYLGLFSFRVRRTGKQTILIRPKPLPIPELTVPRQQKVQRWVPRRGGGFSENHEHRPYRPGDKLNQLHWKLSAKVGSLILREPMEPVRGSAALCISISGTPEELDRKFGRLLWAGQQLLAQELDFDVRAMTGTGAVSLPVDSAESLLKAVDTLLCSPMTETEWQDVSADGWHYRIGGDADEA